MARIEKTVFISYRRTDVYTALAVYERLKNQGYDVFFDYRSISSGDFEQIITSNIQARAHFLIILTPTALDRCNEPGDWLRREIETAIDEKRNIIPLFFKGFRFGSSAVSNQLTGKLKNLSRYNGLNMHEDYFEEGMQRLCDQFLNILLDTVLHPVSVEVQRVVKEEKVAADIALREIGETKELNAGPNFKTIETTPVEISQNNPNPIKQLSKQQKVKKQSGEKPNPEWKSWLKPSWKDFFTRQKVANHPRPIKTASWRVVAIITGGGILTILLIWGGKNIWKELPAVIPNPTQASQSVAPQISQATKTKRALSTSTNTLSPTRAFISPTAAFSVTVEPTPILRVVNAFAGGGGVNLREIPNGKILAVVLNGTVVTVIPDETRNVNGLGWVHVIAIVNGVRIEGWMDGSVLINTVTPP